MSRSIKVFGLSPIQLSLLVISLYFSLLKPSFLTIGICLFFLGRLFREHGRAGLKICLVVLLPFGLYFGGQTYFFSRQQQDLPREVTHLDLIPDSIRINGDGLSFRGTSDGKTYQAFYKLKSQEEQKAFQQLTQPVRLIISASLEEPAGQRNFNGFDYKAYLSTQGIHHLVQIDTIDKIQPLRSFNPFVVLSSLRQKALVHIRRHFPNPMRHYLTGLLFGYLDKEFEEIGETYSSLGIIHLFALSGMQVGFFVDKFRYVLKRLGLKKESIDLLQFLFSLCYAGLTGFSASVIRSLIQKHLSNYRISGFDNLGLTVLISFFIMPQFLLTAGGVLSFAYAFILTLFSFEDSEGIKRQLVESLSLSLGILPLLIGYFASFQPLSIPLTFVFSLLFDSFLLPLVSFLFLLSPFWVIAELNSLFGILEGIIIWLDSLGLRPIIFGQPSLGLILVLLVCLGTLYDYRQKKSVVGSFILLLVMLFFMVKHPLENEVTVIDVGQGDSIFIRDVTGKTILIDVGGKISFIPEEDWQIRQTDSNAERTLIPYLQSRGVGRIDQLVLTHTDTDHIGDMEEVAKAFDIGEVLVSQGSLTNPEFVQRLKMLQLKVRTLTAGDHLSIMSSRLQVLYPWTQGDGGNNDSLVLYGRLLGTNFLFTGDLEDGELELIKQYPNLPVDVLKAGHHGSKGSSYPEFLDHIGVKIALVSAGKDNRYKHPHEETLKRFSDADLKVYRTDQDGAIRFRGWKRWQLETVSQE